MELLIAILIIVFRLMSDHGQKILAREQVDKEREQERIRKNGTE
jgi:hypothetical protein